MKNMSRKTNSEVSFGLLVLIGVMAFVLSGCTSQSANKVIMDWANQNDLERPSDRWETSCGDIADVRGARYCFYKTGPDPQYTIWFFHGAGDSERVFQTSPFNQRSYIELEQDLPSVNIATISYGPIWRMTDNADRRLRPVDATVDTFRKKIVRFIDNGFRPAHPYVAMGHSQGGANVATLCAALPHMWSKCVLLNPMLLDCNPFDSWPVCPTISSPLAALAPNVLIRANYFASEWRKTQPLVLLKKAKTLPPSFVTACSADEFGLFTGPKAWSGQANQLWSNSRWVPGPTGCDHFQWPARAVLEFLGPHKIHSAPVAAVGVEHR